MYNLLGGYNRATTIHNRAGRDHILEMSTCTEHNRVRQHLRPEQVHCSSKAWVTTHLQQAVLVGGSHPAAVCPGRDLEYSLKGAP